MFDQPLQRLGREVQAVKRQIALLQPRDDPEGLEVVVEAAMRRQRLLEPALARMAEGAMAQVVRQRHRLGQILVDAKRPR